MVRRAKDLWGLVVQQHIDPSDLAEAIEAQAAQTPLDYRTRLLIRDALAALEGYWGGERMEAWLSDSPVRDGLEAIRREPFERRGFPSLGVRIMEPMRPEDIEEFLRTIGTRIHHRLRVCIGGSTALILEGYLSRRTEYIAIVDEVPTEIRTQYALLDELERRYGLHIAHFASHYLPSGWEQRVHSRGAFGAVEVHLVDVYDVFLSKLFSAREKDRDDLRELKPQLDKETLQTRLRTTTAGLSADPSLRHNAEENWYILYGEPFPT